MADRIKIIDGPSKWGMMEMAFQGAQLPFVLERPIPETPVAEISVQLFAFAPERRFEIGSKLVQQKILANPGPSESCLLMGVGSPAETGYFTEAIYAAYSWQHRKGLLTHVTHDVDRRAKLRLEQIVFPPRRAWEAMLWSD